MDKKDEQGERKEKEASLKVGEAAYELISKLAKLKGVSIANFFRTEEVENFFRLLYVAELKKESDRMAAKKKKS